MPDDQKVLYQLTITFVDRGGFVDRAKIQSDDPDKLKPEYIEVEGVKYERYTVDDNDYFEIKFDAIVMRSMMTVAEEAPLEGRDAEERALLGGGFIPPPDQQDRS